MLIGATMNTTEIAGFSEMLAGNNITRIFPVNETVDGTAVKVLPRWTDSRFDYCRAGKVIPFVSTKVDAHPGGLAYVRAQLEQLPDWVTTLFITDRHEPEGDLPPGQFQANFNAFLAMVDTLPAGIRSRIRCGPVLTRTWTERPAGKWDYSTYDPGTGDFFGVDMYVQSGTADTVVSPASLPSPTEFLKTLRGYRKTPTDTRPRIIPELGVVGMPADVDGTVRAAWIRGVYEQLRGWGPASTGWEFLGFIWWHATGKATGQVHQIGQRRDFPLHQRTVPGTAAPWTDATVETLPGRPAKPVAAFNDVFRAENPAQPSPGPQSGWDTTGVSYVRLPGLVWMQATIVRTGGALAAGPGRVLFTIPAGFLPVAGFDVVASCPPLALRLTVDARTGDVTFADLGTDMVPTVMPGSRITVHPVTYPTRTG